MRKRIAALGAALLLVGVSASPVSAAFVGPCFAGENNEHDYLDAKWQFDDINYGRGQIDYLRDVATCTGGNGTSLVLPVNIQGPAGLVAQIGYGRIGTSNRYFLWTEDVTSTPAGYMTIFPNAETPQVGHTDLFYMAYRYDDDAWKFTIQDVDDNQSWSNFSDTETTAIHGDELWTGYEVYDSHDQMGGAGANIYTSNIGYIKVGESTIGYLTTTNLLHLKEQGQPGHQDWWSTFSDTANGRSRIRANTVDH